MLPSARFMARRVAALAFAGALLACALAFAPQPAFADQGNPCVPTQEQIEELKAAGTYDEALEHRASLGHDQVSQGLVDQALARAQAARGLSAYSSLKPSSMASQGAARIVALRIAFPASDDGSEEARTFEADDTLAALQALIDGTTPAAYPYNNLHDYYLRSSNGALDLGGTTFDYTAAHPFSYYDEQGDAGVDALISEALEALDAQIDYTQFDGDGDGKIDAVYIHPAGVTGAAWNSTWWSAERPFWSEEFPHVFDGVSIGEVVRLHANSNTEWAVRTMIHETGHVLGLPDYYNYESQTGSGSGERSGILTFDMMYNNQGDHCAFSKYLLGWYDPEKIVYVTATDEGLVVKRGSEEKEVYPLDGGVAETDEAIDLDAYIPDDFAEAGGFAVLSRQAVDEAGFPAGYLFAKCYLVQYEHAANNQSVQYLNGDELEDLPTGYRVFRLNATLNDAGSLSKSNTYGRMHDQLIELVDHDEQEFHQEATGLPGTGQPGYGCQYYEGDDLTPDTYPSTNFYESRQMGYSGLALSFGSTADESAGSLIVSYDAASAPELGDLSLSYVGAGAVNRGVLAFEASSEVLKGRELDDNQPSLVVDGVPYVASMEVTGSTVEVTVGVNPEVLAQAQAVSMRFDAGAFIVGYDQDDAAILSPEIEVTLPKDDTLAALSAWGSYEDAEASFEGSRTLSNVFADAQGTRWFVRADDAGALRLHRLSADGKTSEVRSLEGADLEGTVNAATLTAFAQDDGTALLFATDYAEGSFAAWRIDLASAAARTVWSGGSPDLPEGDAGIQEIDGVPYIQALGASDEGSALCLMAFVDDGEGSLEARFGWTRASSLLSLGEGRVAAATIDGDEISMTVADERAIADALRSGPRTVDEALGRDIVAEAAVEEPIVLHDELEEGTSIGFVRMAQRAGDGWTLVVRSWSQEVYGEQLRSARFDAQGALVSSEILDADLSAREYRITPVVGENGACALAVRQPMTAEDSLDWFSSSAPSDTYFFAPDGAYAGRLLMEGKGAGGWLADGSWVGIGWNIAIEREQAAGAPPVPGIVDGTQQASDAEQLAAWVRYAITEPIDVAGSGDPSEPGGSGGGGEPGSDPDASGSGGNGRDTAAYAAPKTGDASLALLWEALCGFAPFAG